MKHSIAIIGPEDAVSGLKALGGIVFDATTPDDVISILKDIKTKNETKGEGSYAVVIIVEELLTNIPQDDYTKLTKDPLPAIVALPSSDESSGFTKERLRALAKKAVGMDVF